jgi:hypothetical protein
MINGLDRINYDQLTGLVAVKATSIETDEISYDEIYTLDGITSNIQTQLNNIQTTLSNIGSLSISGNTLSGVVLLPYLQTYYYNKQNIDDINTNAYNTIIDIFGNYYTQSQSNAINTLLQNQINSISGGLYSSNNKILTLSNQ